MIANTFSRNRALDGDIVYVELLPEAEVENHTVAVEVTNCARQ